MDTESKFSNVSFGGDWSENIPNQEEIQLVLNWMEKAVKHSHAKDPRGYEMDETLAFIEMKIEKGAMLSEAFRKAFAIQNGGIRYIQALKVYKQLQNWSGL